MKTRIDKTTNPPTLIVTEVTRIALSALQDLSDAQKRVRERGSHYFDADTLHYFRARFHHWTALPDGSILIVESTKRTGFGGPDGAREYRVMRVTIEGEILHFRYMETENPIRYNEKEIFFTAAKAKRAMYKIADRFIAANKRQRETFAIGGS